MILMATGQIRSLEGILSVKQKGEYMSEIEYPSHIKEYMVVFVILAVLTGVELFIPDMDASTMVKGSILTFLACVKAFVVAYSYMHLKDETKWLKFIAAIPITAGVYALMVCLESMNR